jgi:hypothetical protein
MTISSTKQGLLYPNGYQYIDAHFSSSAASSITLSVNNSGQKYTNVIVVGSIQFTAQTLPKVECLNTANTALSTEYVCAESLTTGYYYRVTGGTDIPMCYYGTGTSGTNITNLELHPFYIELDATYNNDGNRPKRRLIQGWMNSSSSTYPMLSYFSGEIRTVTQTFSQLKFSAYNGTNITLNAQVYGIGTNTLF